MPKIFISYSKKTPEPTVTLAKALERAGHEVWWDHALVPGDNFRDVIDRQLEACDVAIVIWTEQSILSNWVRAEADHGAREKKLLPLRSATLEMHRIPKPYGNLHTLPVTDIDAICATLDKLTGTKAKPLAAASPLSQFFKPLGQHTAEVTYDQTTGWNLDSLFRAPAAPKIAALQANVDQRCRDFAATYQDRVHTLSASELGTALDAYAAIDLGINRMLSYLGLMHYSDMNDAANRAAFHEGQDNTRNATSQITFFPRELNAISEPDLQTHLRTDSALEKYTYYLKILRAHKPYQLSAENEARTTQLYEKIREHQDWYDKSVWPIQVTLDPGPQDTPQTVEINDALNQLTSPKDTLRLSAFHAVTKGLSEHQIDIARNYADLISLRRTLNKYHGFVRPEQSRHLSDGIPSDWFDEMEHAVSTSFTETSHKYYAFKAKWLDKDQLHIADRNAPLPFAPDIQMSWDAAKSLILDAFHDFSPEIGQIATRFFNEGWIDARNFRGRAIGDFSHPTCPGANPFVHAWFNGSHRDVIKLGRMLGHGIQQYLATQNGPLRSDVPLALSNAFSSFFEVIVHEAFMKAAPAAHHRALHAIFIEDRLNNIERQTVFNLFERKVHSDAFWETAPAPEDFASAWLDVQHASHGPSVHVPQSAGVMWAYIPHFVHSPFGCLAYAYGGLLSSVMYASHLHDRDYGTSNFAKSVVDAMKFGNTVDHAEILSCIGIDPTDRMTWNSGLDVSASIIGALSSDAP